MTLLPSNFPRVVRSLCAALLLIACWNHVRAQETTPEEDSDFARGVRAFAEGDYERAANLWLTDANLGSADAQFNIGVLYSEGRGLPRDTKEAMSWFIRAAEQGHVEAQYNLGHLLLEDSGNPESVSDGIAWWRRAAEGGFTLAQYNYARSLFHGIGVPRDRESARLWLNLAAAGGNRQAEEFMATHAAELGVSTGAAGDTSIPDSKPNTSNGSDARFASETLSIEDARYVVLGDTPGMVHARFNTRSPVITSVLPGTMLRVMQYKGGWLRVEAPGGFPGWLPLEEVRIDRGLVEASGSAVTALADPTEPENNNDIGRLGRGERMLLLDTEGDWVRVMLPEEVSGWMEVGSARPVDAADADIAALWQRQQTRRRDEALASRPPGIAVEVADLGNATPRLADPPQPVAASPESPSAPDAASESALASGTSGNGQRGDNDDTSPGAEVARDEPARAGNGNGEGVEGDSTGVTIALRDAENGSAVSPPELTATLSPGGSDPRETELTYYRVVTDRFAVLAAPTDEAHRFGALPRDTMVEVVGFEGDFAEIAVPGGLPVWIPDRERDILQRDGEVVIQGQRVAGWSSPADDGVDLGLLPEGSILRLLEQGDGWVRVLAPEWMTAWALRAEIARQEGLADPERLWQRQADDLQQGYFPQPETPLEPVPAADPAAQIAATPTETNVWQGTGIDNDNDWLFAPVSESYTLQLFSLRSRERARSLFGSLQGSGQFYSTVVAGDRWFFVLLGRFATIVEAEAVVPGLPAWASDAEVRSLAALRTTRCGQREVMSAAESSNLQRLCP